MVRNFRFPWQFPSQNITFSKLTTKKQCFLQCFHCLSCLWWEKTYLKCRPLFRSQIFKFCCNIQGLHLIGYLWVSLIIDQSECLICYFLCTELTLFCTELTLFCTELPENCIYLNQSDLNNFFMYIIKTERTSPILSNLFYFHQNMICTYKCIELKTPCVGFVLSHFLTFQSFFIFNFKVALLRKVISVNALLQEVTKKLKNHRHSF